MGKLFFLLHEGIRNIWRHKLTAITAIGSVFLALLIIGIFVVIHQNSHQVIDYVRSNYKIEIFFEDQVTNEEAQEIIEQIKVLDGIQSIKIVTKEDAVRIYQEQFGENIVDILGYNPLPASAVINLDDHGNEEVDVDLLIQELERLPNVDDIVYEGTLIRRVEYFYNTAIKIISYIGIGLLIITIIIISNTVKLSVYAKQDLINNLRSIGATKKFIRTPFIIEGLLEGIIGAGLAIGVIYILINSAQTYFSDFVTFDIEFNLIGVGWILAIAVLIGFIGSYRGIRVLLK